MTAPKGVDQEKIWQEYLAGKTQVRIAKDYSIARNTVIYHIKQMKRKLAAAGQEPSTPTPDGA